MREVFVAGAAMTTFGKFPERGLRSLSEEAVAAALADAGASPDEVEIALFANAGAGLLTGQEMIRGETALRGSGVLGAPIVNVENACASGATAFHLAWLSVASGQTEVALAVGAEKMSHPDRARAFVTLMTALDLERLAAVEPETIGPDLLPAPAPGRSPFMEVYARLTREYQERSGATEEDFALSAVKSHRNAARNPKAQYRDEVTVEQVLSSREIVPPLRLLMCAPVGDGAAALVLASREAVRRLGADPVRVLATVLRTGRDIDAGEPLVTRTARLAYAMAGIDPEEVNVAEVHDAAAPAELMALDELGLGGEHGAAASLRAGELDLDGRIAVNPSGGLQSKGHPIGATGAAQLVELVDQLRGRAAGRQVPGAEIALAENGGGFLDPEPAVAGVTILSRS
jgi:acetyl-CoA acetyltransferase